VGEFLEARRAATRERTQGLRELLTDVSERCGDKASVYATGSVGREEASAKSDLDFFIADAGSPENRRLSRLDEILVYAGLIDASKKLGFPDLGLGHNLFHTCDGLVRNLGTPEDDSENTLTARLLLLLESKPLFGESAYLKVIDAILGRYWRDYPDHQGEFVPAFLANDVLRMWRTFCVNYEAKRKLEPPERLADARLKHYKLAHSRLLTCYSALLYLLYVYSESGTVTPLQAKAMVSITPTARIEYILCHTDKSALRTALSTLIERYEAFLQSTGEGDEVLRPRFGGTEHRTYSRQAREFGECMFNCLELFSSASVHKTFYRFLLV